MAQEISRRPIIAEARVRECFNLRGICDGQSGTGTGFSPISSVSSYQYYSTVVLHTPISSEGWTVDPLEAAVQRYSLTSSTWTTWQTQSRRCLYRTTQNLRTDSNPWYQTSSSLKMFIVRRSSQCLARNEFMLTSLEMNEKVSITNSKRSSTSFNYESLFRVSTSYAEWWFEDTMEPSVSHLICPFART
jgi:hypothetical protein